MQLIDVIEIPSQNNILIIREKRITRFVNIKNITYINSSSYLSVVHTISGEKIVVSKILKIFEQSLNKLGFIRINRSIIVNLFYVERYESGKYASLIMNNNEHFPVTRKQNMKFSI